MKYVRKTYIPDLATLKLANVNEDFQQYFHKTMLALDEQLAGSLQIVNNMNNMRSNALAQFAIYYDTVNTIELPFTYAKYDNQKHELVLNDIGLIVFIHESNHFNHLVVDQGYWSSRLMHEKYAKPLDCSTKEAHSAEFVYDAEYECGWRTVNTAYDCLIDRQDLLNAAIGAQFVNLACYRKKPIEELEKIEDTMLKFKIAGEYMKDKKFSSIYDIDNVEFELPKM